MNSLRSNKSGLVVIACFVVWVVFLASPRTVLPIGLAVYLGIAIVLGCSALRHRNQGWVGGLLFALMLVTLPAWVIAGYSFFELIYGQSGNTVPSFWPF